MKADPMAFLERPTLTAANQRVLDAIVWWKAEHEQSPTVGELAELLDCCRTTIGWHEKKLVQAGVITLDAKTGQRRRTVVVTQ